MYCGVPAGLGLGKIVGRYAAPKHLCDAEIRNLHLALFVYNQVFRFDVTMNNAAVMSVLEGFADGRDNGQRFLGVKPVRPEDLAQVDAIHEFHQQKIERAGLPEIVDGDNIWMAQARQCLGFALESLGETLVAGALGREHLESHKTFELRLAGFEDNAHAALADERKHFELRERGSHCLDIRRLRTSWFGRLHGAGHKAARAKTFGRRLRERLATRRTRVIFFHRSFPDSLFANGVGEKFTFNSGLKTTRASPLPRPRDYGGSN